jgi:hypothetical protein
MSLLAILGYLSIVKMLTNQPQKFATKAKSWHKLSPLL